MAIEFDEKTLWTDTKNERGDFQEGIGARLDWYNDALQVCIDDSGEEVAMHIRFNQDGTIAEIVVREELRALVISEQKRGQTEWEIARDGKEEL